MTNLKKIEKSFDVLIDLQFGDCGKGKLIDAFEHYDYDVRFNGADNAGHSVQNEHGKHALNTIPSAILRSNVLCIIGNMVLVNPLTLVDEILRLGPGFPIKERLAISASSQFIIPTHRVIDAIVSKSKIGTTGSGVTAGYGDLYGREGLFLRDFKSLSKSDFLNKLEQISKSHEGSIRGRFGDKEGDLVKEAIMENASFTRALSTLSEMVQIIPDVGMFLRREMMNGKKVVAEGAQSVMLGILHGTYPFVTSSESTPASALSYLGISPEFLGKSYGVFKAYVTRVGRGPFPTEYGAESDQWSIEKHINDTDKLAQEKLSIPFSELNDFEKGLRIQHLGIECGTKTGRLRRIGRLDLPSLCYAICKSGVSELVMTKIDVLGSCDEIEICDYYEFGGQKIYLLENVHLMNDPDLKPHYIKLPGWNSDISNCLTWESLPDNAKTYVTTVQNMIQQAIEIDISISGLSVGPDRKQLFWIKK